MSVESKINKTVEWLKEQGAAAGVKGMLVGVSGGIDSAVVAHLIKRAYPNNSIGVILPVHSSPEQLVDAEELIQSCGITRLYVNLSELNKGLLGNVKSAMGDLFNPEFERISDANMRARLRMTTLYTIANNLNYMVIGTDNAAEVYTGYFTKYGDGGVDLVPIANLLKSEVYEWAKFLDVPEAIINKAPSADLWEGQTDEAEMGTSYKYIDAYLSGEEIPEKDLNMILNLHKKSEHKRNTPPQPPIFD